MSIRPTLMSMASGAATWARGQDRHRFRGQRQDFHVPVPDQDPDEITDLFGPLESLSRKLQVDVTIMQGGYPAVTLIDHPGYRAAAAAGATFGRSRPVPRRW